MGKLTCAPSASALHGSWRKPFPAWHPRGGEKVGCRKQTLSLSGPTYEAVLSPGSLLCPHQACHRPHTVPQDVIPKARVSGPHVLLVGCGIVKLKKLSEEKSSCPLRGRQRARGSRVPSVSQWKAHGTLPAPCMSVTDGLESVLQVLTERSTSCPGLRASLSCSEVSLFGQ